jgi:Ca2+/Na+ antiporter
MVINSLRGLTVIVLALIIIIKDIPFKKLFKDAIIQFYLAVACMLVLLLVDNILGFILSICVLTLYFRIYTSELKSKSVGGDTRDTGDASDHKHHKGCADDKCEMNMEHLVTEKIKIPANNTMADGSVPYITEENLLAAQSNIVNPAEYNREQHNENIYGSQGLDTKNLHIRGFDTATQFLGSLSYDII